MRHLGSEENFPESLRAIQRLEILGGSKTVEVVPHSGQKAAILYCDVVQVPVVDIEM